MATIKDIARLAKTSSTTVSKYLNGGNVLPGNRAAIEKAIRQLDYHVNEFARGLKTNKSKTVGILIPDLRDNFATHIVYHAEGLLRSHGYGIIVCDHAHIREQEREVLSFLINKRVDCIIALPIFHDGEDYQRVIEQKIPLILIDQFLYGVQADTVLINNRGITYQAALELIRAGHRNIALLTGPEDSYTGEERCKGFEDAFRKSGLPLDPGLIFRCDYTAEQGYECSVQLFRNGRRPTAVLSANYDMTLGLIAALNELQLAVPEDVSVVGFDDLILSKIIRPRLWLVAQPLRQIAEQVAQLAINRLLDGDNSPPKTILLNAELMRGESIRNI